MELKYGNMQEYVSKYLGSNRTFMELKFSISLEIF